MDNNKKMKPFLNLIYSVLGLVIFNGIIQFCLYPFLSNKLGEEKFGVVLTLISMISIISGSLGTSVNNARMVFVNEKKSENGDYNILLLIFNILGIGLILGMLYIFHEFTITNVIFLNLLMVVTTFRFYADVEFRRSLKYSSFLIYYVLIGVGYAIGCLVYTVYPVWQVSMLIGEVLCLLFVLIRGNIFKSFFKTSKFQNKIFMLALSFAVGEFINNVILNADRILLKIMLTGSDVTVYYVASLVGKIVALVTVPLTGVIIGYLSKYKGLFNKKMLLIYILGDALLGVLAFLGCYIVSPFLIRLLYPDTYSKAMEILIYAIGASVLFFCSNILMVLILRYKNSRVQLIINVIHLIIFGVLSVLGIHYYGLKGFAIGALIGNGAKLLIILFVLTVRKLDDTRDGSSEIIEEPLEAGLGEIGNAEN